MTDNNNNNNREEEETKFWEKWNERYASNHPSSPTHYFTSKLVNERREQQYPALQKLIYLDSAGTIPPSKQLLHQCFEFLSENILGNPHSASNCSQHTTRLISSARDEILRYFNVNQEKYSVVFVSGSSAGLKIIGETFPFNSQSRLYYTQSNHSSALTIREYAFAKGANVCMIDDHSHQITHIIPPTFNNNDDDDHSSSSSINLNPNELPDVSDLSENLVVYPAVSNFDGQKYSLDWCHHYHSLPNGRWRVMLDASAAMSTSSIDLNLFPFDFVTFSFHKMFGYPCGLGALLIRNDIGHIITPEYFGGGTVEVLLTTQRFHRLRAKLYERLEVGTLNFSSICILPLCFEYFRSLGAPSSFSQYTGALAEYMYKQMSELRHYNQSIVCRIYGDHRSYIYPSSNNIITFQLLRSNGEVIGHAEFDRFSSAANYQLRSGCFCNPGGCQRALQLSDKEIISHHEKGHKCWDENDIMDGKATGLIRISLSYINTFSDCHSFISFLKKYYVDSPPPPSSASNHHSLSISDHHTPLSSLSPSSSSLLLPTAPIVHIKSIVVYPIKSCGGWNVSDWYLTDKGLLFDREWIIVNDNNEVLIGKLHPILTLIKPQIIISEGCMRIHFSPPSTDNHNFSSSDDYVDVPLIPHSSSPSSSSPLIFDSPFRKINLRVCGDRCEGEEEDANVNEWLSKKIGITCKLIRMSSPRFCRPPLAVTGRNGDDNNEERCKQIGFSNESQLLLINQLSVEELRDRIRSSDDSSLLEIDQTCDDTQSRFRANLIISASPPFIEDEAVFEKFKIGDIEFQNIKGCSRCRMICISPQTAKVMENGDPLLSLLTYRRFKGQVLFGRHVVLSGNFEDQCKDIQLSPTITLPLIPIATSLPFEFLTCRNDVYNKNLST